MIIFTQNENILIKSLQQFLGKRLTEPLPGRAAQLKMVPEPLDEKGAQRPMESSFDAKKSSVLMLFFPNKKNRTSLIFTRRSSDINHGGQISFPGGRAEENESTNETALREAQEEIGINPNEVSIAGTMSDLYVSVSNNLVTPVVGFIGYKPAFRLNPAEVEEVFTVPIDELDLTENLVDEQWELHSGASYNVPFWKVHDVPLWGATAMILSEFMEIYGEFKSQKSSNK